MTVLSTEETLKALNTLGGSDLLKHYKNKNYEIIKETLNDVLDVHPNPDAIRDFLPRFDLHIKSLSENEKAIKEEGNAFGGKIKGYQEGATVSSRHEPIISEVQKQAGIQPSTPPTLPTGTTLGYDPQALQTDELIAAGQTTDVAAPQVTAPATQTTTAVTAPTGTAPTLTAYQGALSPEITGVSGTVSTDAQIIAPTGAVEPNSLVTAQQASEASAIAQTRTVSADELMQAATLSDIGVNEVAQANAASTTVDPNATMQGQLTNLQSLFSNGKVPAFAQGVVQSINNILAARGLGASSIAGQAISAGLMDKLVPIAAHDAKVYETLGLTNLSNEQQSAVVNAQLRASMQGQLLTFEQAERVKNTATINAVNNMNLNNQQIVALENAKLTQNMSLQNLNNKQQSAVANAATYAAMDARNLSARVQAAQQNAQSFLQMDVANLTNTQQAQVLNQQYRNQQLFTREAAENATRQLNAKSQMQVDQFFSELGTQVAQTNAARADAASRFIIEQGAAIQKFNNELQDQRDRFNASQRAAIDQSNTQWRRSVNTANNTNVNRVNQLNTQNLLALTQGAQNALWQNYRDEAHWAMTSAENTLSRAHAAAIAAMNQDFQKEMYNEQYDDYVNAQQGEFAFGVIGDVLGKVIDKIPILN